nr:DUF58 domain-containing protein [Verrucomicrobiota bacterium]
MIVPRTRLLTWVSLGVLPFAAIAGAAPETIGVSLCFIAGVFGLAAADAFLARGRLAGIRVQLPELVRLQKEREGTFSVRVENEPKIARAVRIGFAFPREIEAVEEDRIALLPAGAAVSRIDWRCLPHKRGRYFLERAYLEAISPLGFWATRASVPVSAELRVYPNLFEERKNVAALFLRRAELGTRLQRHAGQGREFEKLREYTPGDGIQDVHWKASAKRSHPVTKVFQVERSQEVYLIVDASRLTARPVRLPSGEETNGLERFVTAALLLGMAAEQQGDQFGLVAFSDKVLSFVRARNGQAHYAACRDRLYTLQPQLVSPDFDELATFIRLRLRKRALLIFLTALDDPVLSESFVHNMDLICRQHLILVNMLQPAGAAPIFSDLPVEDADDIYRRLGGHWQWHKLRELE